MECEEWRSFQQMVLTEMSYAEANVKAKAKRDELRTKSTSAWLEQQKKDLRQKLIMDKKRNDEKIEKDKADAAELKKLHKQEVEAIRLEEKKIADRHRKAERERRRAAAERLQNEEVCTTLEIKLCYVVLCV